MLMPRLKVIRGPKTGQEFDLEDDLITIGRGVKNSIVMDDHEISRYHCKFVRVLDDYELHDMHSTNGTFVNGQRVDDSGWLLSSRHLIELGDSITLEYVPTEFATNPSLEPYGSDERQYYLVIKRADRDQSEIYALEGLSISIGRDLSNDIIVQAGEVSRHHLRLARTDTGYSVEDLGTLNGTNVNGKALKRPMRLIDNALITIGTTVEIWYTTDPNTQRPEHHEERATDELHRPTQPDKRSTQAMTMAQAQAESLENRVFIAYDRRDWDTVVRFLYKYLNDQGVPAWVDQALAPEGDAWQSQIERAIAECAGLVVVVTEVSLTVPYIERAYRRFSMLEKPMVLLAYREVERLPMMIEKAPLVPFDAYKPLPAFQKIAEKLRTLSDLGSTRPA